MTCRQCACRVPGHRHLSAGKGSQCGARATETVQIGRIEVPFCAQCAGHARSLPRCSDCGRADRVLIADVADGMKRRCVECWRLVMPDVQRELVR